MSLEAHGRHIETIALGTSLSLLADPDNFTVGLMSITIDALSFAWDTTIESESINENGLFAFFATDSLSNSVVHSITFGAQTSGIWNLVAIQ